MNDFYTEQLVKRDTPKWAFPVKILMILLAVLSIGLVVLIPFAIIVPVALGILAFFLFKEMDVEYEYLYINGTLDIDKIMSKSKRKKVFEMSVNDLELIAPEGAAELRPYQGIKATDYSSGEMRTKKYEMILVQNGNKKRVIFEPNQIIIDGMRMLAPRKVIR